MDLKPEISYEQAHTEFAKIISAWMATIVDDDKTGYAYVSQEVARTHDLVKPMIDSLIQEGFIHF
jgi:hypothetical protein